MPRATVMHIICLSVPTVTDVREVREGRRTLGTRERRHVEDDGGVQVLHRVRNTVAQNQTTLCVRVVHLHGLARVQSDHLQFNTVHAAMWC